MYVLTPSKSHYQHGTAEHGWWETSFRWRAAPIFLGDPDVAVVLVEDGVGDAQQHAHEDTGEGESSNTTVPPTALLKLAVNAMSAKRSLR